MKESEKKMQCLEMGGDTSASLVSKMGWLWTVPKHKGKPHLFWIVGFKSPKYEGYKWHIIE